MNSNKIGLIQIENVILISFDSLRSDNITDLKNNKAPNFCLMRDEGVFFKNAIVQAPFTIPSHCSMLTGLYPAKIGVHDMHHQLPPDIPSIFNLLKKESILTLSLATTPMLKTRKITGIDKHLNLSTRELAKTINKNKGRRFFAFIHYWDTHTPYETWLPINHTTDLLLNLLKPIKRFKNLPGGNRLNDILELYRTKRIRLKIKKGNPQILKAIKKGYVKSIYTADKFLGNILTIIKKSGIVDKTLFILMGDHGDSFNEHSEIHRQPEGRYEHGHFQYDNILKVPLILYSPKIITRKCFDEQVQLIDIAPTILEALKLNHEGFFDGISLWGAIMGQNSQPSKKFTFSEVVRESRDLELRCVRSSKTKIIFDSKLDKYELYDLIHDPGEQNNLWPNDPHNEKNDMLKALNEFSKIENKKSYLASESDQKKIEKVLRDLGYL